VPEANLHTRMRITSKRRNAYRSFAVCILALGGSIYAHPEMARKLTVPIREAAAPASTAGLSAPSNLTTSGASNNAIDLTWSASTDSDTTVKILYQIHQCQGNQSVCKAALTPCSNPKKPSAGCFITLTDEPSATTYSAKGLTSQTTYTFAVTAINASDPSTPSGSSNLVSLKTASGSACLLFPTRHSCMDYGTDSQANINSFYQTNGSISYLNQIKSIYNGASGSATVSADVATLNFGDGMQLTATTNIQAGSAGTATVNPGSLPTLSSTGAGQATQNVIYGGNFLVSELYPVMAVGGNRAGSPGNFGYSVDLVFKEGADIQNFKSGTNVSVTSPPFHGSAHLAGYLQYNSINLNSSGVFQGAIYAGASYGYDYISHGYARDYGFGNRVHNDLGQVSVGILINGVANISVSRAFGPPQTYIDSTSQVRTTVNNFKAVSFGITYQSPAPNK